MDKIAKRVDDPDVMRLIKQILKTNAMGKTITLATTMLAYIFAAVLGPILTITLGMALYHYINERHCTRQLTAFRNLVNQSKAYELDDITSVPEPDSFNYAARTWAGDTLERTFFRNETNPKIGQFEIKYPSVSTLFFHHKPELREIATEFQPTLT